MEVIVTHHELGEQVNTFLDVSLLNQCTDLKQTWLANATYEGGLILRTRLET